MFRFCVLMLVTLFVLTAMVPDVAQASGGLAVVAGNRQVNRLTFNPFTLTLRRSSRVDTVAPVAPLVRQQFVAPIVRQQFVAPIVRQQFVAPYVQQQVVAPLVQQQVVVPYVQQQVVAPLVQPLMVPYTQQFTVPAAQLSSGCAAFFGP